MAKMAAVSIYGKKVQVGNDQKKAQSEKDSHSKNRGSKKLNYYTMNTYRNPNEQLYIFPISAI